MTPVPAAPTPAPRPETAAAGQPPHASGQSLGAELRGSAMLFALSVATTLGTVSGLTALQRLI